MNTQALLEAMASGATLESQLQQQQQQNAIPEKTASASSENGATVLGGSNDSGM